MVTVEEAIKLIDQHTIHGPVENKKLDEALNYILFADVCSPIDMPPFRQSAMDGYALNFTAEVKSYHVIGEIAAGSSELFNLKPGEAVRIFTGAAVPDSANVVVQQEIVERVENNISLMKEIQMGQNIRPRGEQISSNEVALKKGTVLNPAALGFLTTLGLTDVLVHRKPAVAILTTGSELVKPGTPLKHGQIYESNSVMLMGALMNYGFDKPTMVKVKDDLQSTTLSIQNLLAQHDFILISGGISVGDYDYVKEALTQQGVQEIFYKVKQKPGKPVFFGRKENKIVFALPGNPASALTCFYVYALPALQKFSGISEPGLQRVKLKLNKSYSKKPGLAHFLKSTIYGDEVTISDSQSSAMLNSFAQADAMIYLPADQENFAENSVVDVLLIR